MGVGLRGRGGRGVGQQADVEVDDDVTRTATHDVRVGVFPISIDSAGVEEMAAGRATRKLTSQIRARLGDPALP